MLYCFYNYIQKNYIYIWKSIVFLKIVVIKKIIEEIETNNTTKISFFCNHGKHRSVGWTEILKKYYYPNSIIKHNIK